MIGGAGALACSGGDSPADPPPTCASQAALSGAPYTGASLGAKQLALTFDDGPGSRSAELAAYLKAEGIPAAFFVNGKNVPAFPVIAELVADGHVVANHTQDHADLTDRSRFPATQAGNSALVAELSLTDTLIAPYVPSGRFLFRAPYGAFDGHDYAVLHPSAMDKYIGTIGWDIGGERTQASAADWACWQETPKLTTKACGDLYRQEIDAVGRGIVLMHDADYGDPSNHALTSGVGNTVDMVKYLVPLLKASGYTFVRVDHVPDISAALPPLAVDAGVDASDASDRGDAGARDASAPAHDAAASDGSTNAPASKPADPQPQGPSDPCAAASTSARHEHAH